MAARETLCRKLDRLSDALNQEGVEDEDSLKRQFDSLNEGLQLLDTVLSMGSDSKLTAFVGTLKDWAGRAAARTNAS